MVEVERARAIHRVVVDVRGCGLTAIGNIVESEKAGGDLPNRRAHVVIKNIIENICARANSKVYILCDVGVSNDVVIEIHWITSRTSQAIDHVRMLLII